MLCQQQLHIHLVHLDCIICVEFNAVVFVPFGAVRIRL